MTQEKLKQRLEEELDFWEDYGNLTEVMSDWLKIRTEKGEILPLISNVAQEKILNIIIPLLKEKKLIRLIILKARQQGISTLIQALFFIILFVGSNLRALTMGHETASSNNLFNIYSTYYNELPKILQPTLEFSNEKKKKYLASRCENKIETAGKGEVGRSDTLQLLHLTEVAFYPDAKKTLGALLQAAKYAMMIVIESTANGIGDEFYNMYKTAKDGESDYIAIFLSWLDFPNYSKEFRNAAEKERLLSDLGSHPMFNEYAGEEQLLIDEYHATLEQLNWRRWAILNLCQKDVKTFHQEYPRDDIEAFVTSGNPVFNTRICNEKYLVAERLEKELKQPLRTGNLIPIYKESDLEYEKLRAEGTDSYYDLRKYIADVLFEDDPKGFIKIYGDISHRDGERYKFCAGGDVAEGLEQGDFDCLKVLNRKTNEVVLTWHGHIDPDLFANEMHKIQILLGNDVYFAIERNNHGLSTIISAAKLGVTQYYAQNFETGYPKDTDFLGFKTTVGSRTPAINDLKEWIRENEFNDYEKEYWSECLTFVKNAKGKMQAQGKDKDPSTKCYDDRVFASLIMLRCHLWLPNYIKREIYNEPPWLKKLKKKPKYSTTAMSG